MTTVWSADTLNLIFQANGYESEAVYSAAAGLERARTFAPGLLLCDVTMPLETGLQLADKLHSEMARVQGPHAFGLHQQPRPSGAARNPGESRSEAAEQAVPSGRTPPRS